MGLSSSVVSYPQRGSHGNNRYRGNCTGFIVKDFVTQYLPPSGFLADPSLGGGTTADVAKELGLDFYGTDLHQGFNLLTDDFATQMNRQADAIWWHPPYWDMINYSGNMWGEKGVSHPWDMSRMSLDDFIEAMVVAMMNIHDATVDGGHYGILMGNLRRKGNYYNLSAMVERVSAGKLVDEIIKMQHNCVSDNTNYGRRNFVPIAHEKLLIFKKNVKSALIFLSRQIDRAERSLAMTWKAALRRLLQTHKESLALKDIYESIKPFAQTKENNNWEAKVRQTLQDERYFERVETGVYKLKH